jgi:pilus assembly protein Flp/PilA
MLVSPSHTARSRYAKMATRPGPDGFLSSRFIGGVMQSAAKWIKRLIGDEQGGEVLEYAMIAGLISVAAISVIGAFGTKVVAKWTSINSSM